MDGRRGSGGTEREREREGRAGGESGRRWKRDRSRPPKQVLSPESAQAKPEGRKKGFICSQLFIAFRCSGGVGARPIRSQYPRVPVRAIRIHYRAEPRPLSFHRCKSHFIPSLTVSFYLFVVETYRYRTRGQRARALARTYTHAYVRKRAPLQCRECNEDRRERERACSRVGGHTCKIERHVFYNVCARNADEDESGGGEGSAARAPTWLRLLTADRTTRRGEKKRKREGKRKRERERLRFLLSTRARTVVDGCLTKFHREIIPPRRGSS